MSSSAGSLRVQRAVSLSTLTSTWFYLHLCIHLCTNFDHTHAHTLSQAHECCQTRISEKETAQLTCWNGDADIAHVYAVVQDWQAASLWKNIAAYRVNHFYDVFKDLQINTMIKVVCVDEKEGGRVVYLMTHLIHWLGCKHESIHPWWMCFLPKQAAFPLIRWINGINSNSDSCSAYLQLCVPIALNCRNQINKQNYGWRNKHNLPAE